MKFDHAIAPSYEHLRPYKPKRSDTFPVYPELVEMLVKANNVPDADLPFVMAVCSSYAYGDPPTSLITWLTDFQVDPVRIKMQFPKRPGKYDKFEEYPVHGGFHRNVRSTPATRSSTRSSARSRAAPCCRTAAPSSTSRKRCTSPGHSLGGASAAMLAAMLLADTAYKPILDTLKAVYTYAAPMIASPEFAQACDRVPFLREQVIRYVYANDIVPQVPPKESARSSISARSTSTSPPGATGAGTTTRRLASR